MFSFRFRGKKFLLFLFLRLENFLDTLKAELFLSRTDKKIFDRVVTQAFGEVFKFESGFTQASQIFFNNVAAGVNHLFNGFLIEPLTHLAARTVGHNKTQLRIEPIAARSAGFRRHDFNRLTGL